MNDLIKQMERKMQAMDDKLNVILDFCLQQNNRSKELAALVQDLRREMAVEETALAGAHPDHMMTSVPLGPVVWEPAPSMREMSIHTGDTGLSLDGPIGAVRTKNHCPACGAIDQMQEVREDVRNEQGQLIAEDAPALECQICGEVFVI